MIYSIPISAVGVADKWIWHFDKPGKYSIESGYHVARLIRDFDGRSGVQGERHLQSLG